MGKMNKAVKCDVVIPVYNAPDWVKLCVYSLILNTPAESLGEIFLMDDKSNELTKDCLDNLKKKYPKHITIVTNKENLGFVKNSNNGLKLTKSKYVLLLNSDCLVSKNTIPKLISHMQRDPKIGLISPISNNAANLSLEIFPGFSFTQMDLLLEKKFAGVSFDACTIVGNCLMLSRECIKKVGYLDEAYGMGYGEETDYQFLAMSKGFLAKVAIDTYVYHKAEASFGTSEEKKRRVEENRKLFFSRWGEEYRKVAEKYNDFDPIEHINSNLSSKDKEINIDTLFFLPQITQNSGGCHVVVDIVNYLAINGFNANILYEQIYDYEETMLFKPIPWVYDLKFNTRQLVSTIWISVFRIYSLVREREIPLINFIQGYENYFENGKVYNSVALTHKMMDEGLTISTYLHNKIKNNFGYFTTVIKNGVNYDLMHHLNKSKRVKNITFVMRGNPMKGDYLLSDIIKQIDNTFKDLELNIVRIDNDVEVPFVKNNILNIIDGPISKLEMINIFRKTDIYVDASVNEGFGLMGLEAMTCGAVPIMSESFGINDYAEDEVNAFVIKEVNNSDKFIEKISLLINNPQLFLKMKREGAISSLDFDYDSRIDAYIKFFKKNRKYEVKSFSKEEQKLLSEREYVMKETKPKGISVVKFLNRLVPEFVRRGMKKIISWLYSLYE